MDKEAFVANYAVDRKNSVSLKWDLLKQRFGDPDLIPMWVADMEFRTAEAVTDALKARLDHGVFGYAFIPDSYYQAVFDWEERHFGYRPHKEDLRLATGVVPALYWFVNCFTQPGESVLIMTPVYYPFHGCVTDCGRKLVTCDLVYRDGYFTIDYDAFEKSITDNDVKMFILRSPHNPAGRVWTEEELDRMLSICQRHGVIVISDEIHQDFVFCEHKHIAAPAVSGGKYADQIVLVNAASKSFNLAGLIHANIFISSPELRQKYDAYAKLHNETDYNIMGLIATEAAYTGGEEWLEGLKALIRSNYEYVKKELNEKVPEITVCAMEGTYLPMLDLSGLIDVSGEQEIVLVNNKPVAKPLFDFAQSSCGLAVDYGSWFGKNFPGFIRLNLATIPENVEKTVSSIVRECAKLRK